MKKRIVKFEVQDLLPIGLTLIVAGIGIVYGMNVMGDLKSDFCEGSGENYLNGSCYVCNTTTNFYTNTSPPICTNTSLTGGAPNSWWNSSSNYTAPLGGGADVNASRAALKGVAKIPEKMPLIATVIIAAIIIGILVRYLLVRYA